MRISDWSSDVCSSDLNAASFALRGVSVNNIIVYYEAPVGVLLDDFVMPSVQTQLLDTFDIAQLEVLRGPQGTLFGKNTTGGAVTVRTKRPELDRIGGEARATRSEQRRLGQECVRTCSSRWSPAH